MRSLGRRAITYVVVSVQITTSPRALYLYTPPPTRLPVKDVVSYGPAALPLGVAAQLLDLGGHGPRADGLDVDQELHEHASLGVPRQMA